ncbi:MAG: nucleotide exchange factor GrpE [Myxococcota bacterium]
MSKSTPPEEATHSPASIEIEIDPSLIEAAVAAVESRAQPPVPAPAPQVEAEVEIEAPSDPPPGGSSVEENWMMLLRVGELTERIEALEAEVSRARDEAERLEAQLSETRRLASSQLADFERYRGRARKDNEESERRGEERALKAMLEIFDNVERARLYDHDDPQQIASGLRMIVEQFRRQLGRVGMERIAITRGIPFDPEVHEAVAHVPDAEAAEGSVLEEVTAGFRLRGRLFRPARVTVASRVLSGDRD